MLKTVLKVCFMIMALASIIFSVKEKDQVRSLDQKITAYFFVSMAYFM